ncbi:hypothetical protein [Kitasatospora camelliae]|uniref:DUF11 domain-containing protein n=1 Tax=Kitasatospora camelliae TaxID=3156397 RepID=A0AAU8K6K2_9ACTN
MKIETSRLRPIVAAVAVAATLLAPAPLAHAAESSAGEVAFVYDAAQMSEDGSHVSWGWTVSNRSGHAIHDVVLTHAISPSSAVRALTASGPCTVDENRISCRWPEMKAEETSAGIIGADIPADSEGSVQIRGRIVWR